MTIAVLIVILVVAALLVGIVIGYKAASSGGKVPAPGTLTFGTPRKRS